MSRTFIYARLSTVDRSTDDQIHEIESAGFALDDHLIVCENINGNVAAAERPQFAQLLARLKPGDVLIVTKLDRLGSNAIDVRATLARLAADSVRVHCLSLGGVDLTSAAGTTTMRVLDAVAEFERDLLLERTQAGIAPARAEGKTLGRPPALTKAQEADAMGRLTAGDSVARVARDFGTTRQSIMRVRTRHRTAAAATS